MSSLLLLVLAAAAAVAADGDAATVVDCNASYDVPPGLRAGVVSGVVAASFGLIWLTTCLTGLTPCPRGCCGPARGGGALSSGRGDGLLDPTATADEEDGDGVFHAKRPRPAGAAPSAGGVDETTGLLGAAARSPQR